MGKTLWLVNLFLVVLALALVYGMVQSFSVEHNRSEEAAPRAGSVRETNPAAETEGMVALLKKPSPPLSDFDVIVAKETFKNPFAVVPRSAAPPPPPPLPPLPNLIGTMFVGEERRAVMTSGDKTEIYKIGQAVAGGKIVEIEADRVSIDRNGNREVVALKAALQPAPAARPRPETPPAQPEAVEASPAAPAAPEPQLPGSRNILRRSGR
jgi:hypothetical protein